MYCRLNVEIQLLARQIGVKMTEMLLKVFEMIDLGMTEFLDIQSYIHAVSHVYTLKHNFFSQVSAILVFP